MLHWSLNTKGKHPKFWEDFINWNLKAGEKLEKLKKYFQEKSGGKSIVRIKKLFPLFIVISLVITALLSFVIPKEDHTFYKHTSGRSEYKEVKSETPISDALKRLFEAGKQQLYADKKAEAEQNRKKFSVKYSANQIVGDDNNGPSMIRSGAKLIGILKNPIDTRAQTMVRAILPRGGQFGDVEIEPGSTLVGHFSYNGDNDIVYVKFSRLDPPDGSSPKKISATALDAGNFTPGIQGEEFTGNGTKLAASLGLSMFAGMTDTLTDRQSLGNSFNGVQAAPTMKNALLQGLSRASQDQASRTASEIQQVRNYVIVPEGKEMIIELQEDYK